MKKILTIDGGGIKGVFAASFLAELENMCRIKIGDYFDLIAGTSTGGIIAAAIALGIPAQKILQLYLENGKMIFPVHRRLPLFHGKYNSAPLENILSEIFGSYCLKDCKTRLLIPAFNLISKKVRVFKTSHAQDLYYDKDLAIKDCLLATTAAPTYFNPYKMEGGVFVDGGIGANNPSLIALVEGITRCGWLSSEISLLSIGGVTEFGIVTGNEKMGLFHVNKIVKCFMEAESQYAENICNIMLPHRQYFRINQMVEHGQVSLDKVSEKSLSRLKDLGVDSAVRYVDDIKQNFLYNKADKVQFCNLEG